MASKDGKDLEREAEDVLPPAIIAQAEAAMYANLKYRRRGLIRSNTDVIPDTSQFQTAYQTSGRTESSLAR
jgi:hypothetical protein